jgi:tetratricopeptide (TPR) repeat protein
MIYLRNLLKKRILPIMLVVGGIYLIYLAWWSFSGQSRVDTYGENTIFAYQHRWYKMYDRIFFDEIHPADTFHFQQIIPFYFGKNGFTPYPQIINENNIKNIVRKAVASSSDESVDVILNNIQIDSLRVKQRTGYKLRFLIELLEEVTDLGTGALSWMGKKTDGYALVVDYSVVMDSISNGDPIRVFMDLPGLFSFAEKDSLLPVFHPILSQYEVIDGSSIFLGHVMPHPSIEKSSLWSWLKYVIFGGFIIVFASIFVFSKRLENNDDDDEDEDGVNPEKMMWNKEQWADHYATIAAEALEDGDYQKAIEKTEKAIDEGYLSDNIYCTGISAAIKLQDYNTAERFSVRALKKYPDNVMLFLLSAQAAMAQGDYVKAKEQFDKAIELDTENDMANATWFSAAICSAAMGLKEDALYYISNIPAESYENPEILQTMALIYAELEMPAEREEILRQWLQLEPDNLEAQNLLKQYNKIPPKRPMPKQKKEKPMNNPLQELEELNNKNALIQQAKQLKEEGRYKEVVLLLWPLFEQDFSDPIIALYLAEAQNQLGEYGQSRNLLLNALKSNPKNISLLQELAIAQFYSDEAESALQTSQKILQLQPHNIVAKRVAADTLTELGDHEKAFPIFKELERLDKLTNHNIYNLSNCYIEREEYEQAIMYLKKHIDENGECEVCWNNIAYCYKKMEMFIECIDAADKSLTINAEYANPMFHKAAALYELGIFEEAFEWAEKSAKLGSSNAAETLADWKINFEE